MRLPIASLLLAATLAPIHAQTTPAKPVADPILHRVDDHYNRLRTLRSRYAEHYAGLGMDRTETGTLLLRKPGLMRWTYDQPPGKLFVLDGKFAWFYTPGDPQVSRAPARQLDDLRSPLRFLLGHTQLTKELDHITVVPEGSAYRITGIPTGMAERVRLLTLVVSAEGVIQRLKLEETDGALTEFTFTHIEENIPTSPADFTFTPPPNLPIVDAASPI